MTTPRDILIMEWHKAQVALAQAKEAESILRAQVIQAVFQPKPLTEGVKTLELGNGYKLKAKFKVGRKFTVDSDWLIDFLNNYGTTSEEAFQVTETLVRWKAELALSAYRVLPEHHRQVFDAMLVASDEMPSLELVTP